MPETIQKFIRTCQECGNEQEDIRPSRDKELSNAYTYRKCKKCKSESLDYGSEKTFLSLTGERVSLDFNEEEDF